MQKDSNRLPDTPWHIGYTKMDENDTKRHKAYCIYYNNDTKECITAASPCYQTRCGGSSHCMVYTENIFKKNIYLELASHLLFWNNERLEEVFEIKYITSSNGIDERRDKQVILKNYIYEHYENRRTIEKYLVHECKRVSRIYENQDTAYNKVHDAFMELADKMELPKHGDYSEKNMGKSLYRNTVFLFVIVIKSLLEDSPQQWEKYFQNYFFTYGYYPSESFLKKVNQIFGKKIFAPYYDILLDKENSNIIKALCLERCFYIFCDKFFELSSSKKGPCHNYDCMG